MKGMSYTNSLVQPELHTGSFRKHKRWNTAKISGDLFVLGGIVGALQVCLLPIPWGAEMVTSARNLAEYGSFADPFAIDKTGFTAAVPPLYPFLLAVIFKLLKSEGLVALAAATGSVVMNAVTASWLPRISVLFFNDVRAGVIAALLWLSTMQLKPNWDTSYTLAGLLFVFLYSAPPDATRNPLRQGALAGMIAGFLLLLNPAALMVLLPWLGYLLIRRKQSVVYICLFLGCLSLAPAAWMARNYIRLGSPVLRTNLGMTLFASNNDCAKSSLKENQRNGCYLAHHPDVNRREARAIRSMGEVQYDRMQMASAANWITTNPDKFWQLTLRRFSEFWFPQVGEPPYIAHMVWLSTALSVPGLIIMAWRREPLTPFVAIVLLIYPAMYYLVVTDVRYRYPVLWLTLLPAGYFLSLLRTSGYAMRLEASLATLRCKIALLGRCQ